MARWTVVHGQQHMVIETTGDQIAIDVGGTGRFIGTPDDMEEIRVKLAAAIGTARGEVQS